MMNRVKYRQFCGYNPTTVSLKFSLFKGLIDIFEKRGYSKDSAEQRAFNIVYNPTRKDL